jgi:hypothetical protein
LLSVIAERLGDGLPIPRIQAHVMADIGQPL